MKVSRDFIIGTLQIIANGRGVEYLTFWTDFATWWEENRHILTMGEAVHDCGRRYALDLPMPWEVAEGVQSEAEETNDG